jgi:hypothetical protein
MRNDAIFLRFSSIIFLHPPALATPNRREARWLRCHRHIAAGCVHRLALTFRAAQR